MTYSKELFRENGFQKYFQGRHNENISQKAGTLRDITFIKTNLKHIFFFKGSFLSNCRFKSNTWYKGVCGLC
jgi:hypothetical protein